MWEYSTCAHAYVQGPTTGQQKFFSENVASDAKDRKTPKMLLPAAFHYGSKGAPSKTS